MKIIESHVEIFYFILTHGTTVIVTDGNFAPVCHLRERHVDQWLFREFLSCRFFTFLYSRIF